MFRFSEKQLDIIYEVCPEFKYVDDGIYIPHLEHEFEDGVTLKLFYNDIGILLSLYEPKKPEAIVSKEISEVRFADFSELIDYLKG